MIKIEKHVVGALESNSFLVIDDSKKQSLLIDAGGDYNTIKDKAAALGHPIGALLLTHGHFDHTADAFLAADSGVKVYISEKDAFMLSSARNCLAENFGIRFEPCKTYSVIKEGDANICGFSLEVIATPGHTAGSVCYKIGEYLFCGDTVFKYGYGRYDLPTGDFGDLVRSFKKLKKYCGLKIFCGHGEDTDLDEEKKFNPLFIYEN